MADDNHSNGSITLHRNDVAAIQRALYEIIDVSLALKGLASSIHNNSVANTDAEIMAVSTAVELLGGKAGWLADMCMERFGELPHGDAMDWFMPEGCLAFRSKADKLEVANG